MIDKKEYISLILTDDTVKKNRSFKRVRSNN